MVSNLSSIGFVFANNDEFAAKMVALAGHTDMSAPCAHGEYALWRQPSGAQLWFHISDKADATLAPDERAIAGLTPFFEGSSEVPVNVTKAVHRGDDNDFEGGFYAWVAPDESGEGAYPIVFDAVDFAVNAARPMPFAARLRLAGFAREIKAFANQDDYENALGGEQPKLAARSFIPIGLFAASAADEPASVNGDTADEPLSATALLTGIVADHHLLKNEETGQDFHWLVVESLEAAFDIVADPEAVSGTICKGGVVQVACWFFGRFLD